MANPSEKFSNEQYFNGLHTADETVLKSVYAEFRQPVVRAITTLGGSEAAGSVFFQTAIVEASRQTKVGKLSAETPFFYQIKALALAHYRDWLTEREQHLLETKPNPDEPDLAAMIPSSEALRDTRQTIEAWKKGEKTDDENYPLWQKIRELEQASTGAAESAPKSNLARNLLILFVLLTSAYFLFVWYSHVKTPAEVYQDNFAPPESLIADFALRYDATEGNDSMPPSPKICESLLREADEFYKNKNYASAQGILLGVLHDSLAVCHSDALFYIGVIALAQEEPGLTLECFAKIEDLERFGEDIYWYQALAFVKLAEKNPLFREKATQAVERARSNAQDSLRRVQAEKMLKQLEN